MLKLKKHSLLPSKIQKYFTKMQGISHALKKPIFKIRIYSSSKKIRETYVLIISHTPLALKVETSTLEVVFET